jgi:formate--tetrahydrofolate ligase
MKSDLEIAQENEMRPLAEVASEIGVSAEDLEFYGPTKAKIPLQYLDPDPSHYGKLILVTAMTPTPAGEGKTTVSIGLAEGMNRIKKKTTVVLREPSLGPVFGIKGGAAGGGYSQVVPMEEINLHFTGDFAAITGANNLLAAMIDNHLHYGHEPKIDARRILWKRVTDMNDRSLREITVGLGGPTNGFPRTGGFDITPASEIMAILCLSENFADLKERLGNILVGFTRKLEPVYARDIRAVGAMALLLRDAIKPNLVQTLEGNPAILHGGPFANIAQGTNSVIATKMGLSLSDYVITEAGFASDLGAEKFFDIKCGYSGLKPSASVVVATVQALHYHGGVALDQLKEKNVEAIRKGFQNLLAHLEIVRKYHIEPVVAINAFHTDDPEEHALIQELCAQQGVQAVVSEGFAKGSEGTEALARAVVEAVDGMRKGSFKTLYSWDLTVKEKIEKVAREIYGASEVEFDSNAERDLRRITRLGLDGLPVCIAKTQKSLSDNETLRNRPKNHILHVRGIEIAAGAGFVIPITGTIMRMPGLPKEPAAYHMDVDDNGRISGLS